MARLLLVEDDAEIRRALIRVLTEFGHTVTSAATGMAGLHQAVEDQPDVVVLDLGLPDVDGRTVLRMLRAVSAVPVVVVTAQDDEQVIVDVLDLGADDYVCKPFGVAQLDARIRAVLRRTGTDATDEASAVVIGELVLEPAAREARLSGVPLELAAREFDLLVYLARRAGTVVTKRELSTEVWRQPYRSSDKTVDVHLSWLRRKLGESARAPRYLHTVRGVGVKLAPPGSSRAGAEP